MFKDRPTSSPNRIGHFFITKEIIKPCQLALIHLRDQIDVHGSCFDDETQGVEITGESHLFDRVSDLDGPIPWYYPITWKHYKEDGVFIMGIIKSEYPWT